MRRWGLEVHLRDLHELVKRARKEAKTVVLGGHSLGASLVSFYAAHTFEGTGQETP
jgi:pimeloyl-ACP methyl ester carboxylesterase